MGAKREVSITKEKSRCEQVLWGILTEETHTNETGAQREGHRRRRAREGVSDGSPKVRHRTERKRSAVEAIETAGELADGSEAQIRRADGRKGDGVDVKFRVLTRGGLSASAHAR
jgi:hypothetical protein